MRSISPLIFAVLAFSICQAQSRQDVLYLSNGDIIKGKIIENKINDYIRIELLGGSRLTYQYSQIDSLAIEFAPNISNRPESSPSPDSRKSPDRSAIIASQCFTKGGFDGVKVNTSGPAIAGLAGGLIGGIVGWGIVYTLVASNTPEPSLSGMGNFDSECRSGYIRGYKKAAKKSRTDVATFTALLGTVVWVLIII